MELETLTPKTIERALKALQRAQDPPTELLELEMLDASVISATVAKRLALQKWLTATVAEALRYQRNAEGLSYSDDPPPSSRQAMLDRLAADFQPGNPDLEAWSALYHRYLTPLPFKVGELSQTAHVSPQQFRRRLNRGLAHLAAALRKAETEARRRSYLPPGRHVPAPEYACLFGVQEHVQYLARQLSAPDGPRFLSIEGLGGIGKTALARAVVQRRMEEDDLADVLWISARSEQISERGTLVPLDDPAQSLDDIVARLATQLGLQNLVGLSTPEKLARLQPTLREEPYLVVIDNLETLTDIEALMPALQPLAKATRFLLTSRHTLASFPYAHVFAMPELSRDDSQALVESELARRGIRDPIPAALVEQLYRVIGGLPLALKLVAAQVGRLAWEEIIAGLQTARRKSQATLYTFIYRRTWQMLSDAARRLLLAMLPLNPEGEDLPFIQTMSGLPETDFEPALAQLLDYSLLEVQSLLKVPHYSLHRLTITFLQTDILRQWDE
jgi:hypothetical protein